MRVEMRFRMEAHEHWIISGVHKFYWSVEGWLTIVKLTFARIRVSAGSIESQPRMTAIRLLDE